MQFDPRSSSASAIYVRHIQMLGCSLCRYREQERNATTAEIRINHQEHAVPSSGKSYQNAETVQYAADTTIRKNCKTAIK